MAQNEEELLSRFNYCPEKTIQQVDENLHSLDVKEAARLVEKEFYNDDVMKALGCIINVISSEFKVSSQTNGEIPRIYDDNIRTYDRIRSYFSDLKSVNGDFVGSLNSPESKGESINNYLLVKTPLDSDNRSSVHEAFVGIYGTNDLRKKGVPNFGYVYGMFRCPPPFVDAYDEKNIITYCNGSSNYTFPYVVYENVGNLKLSEYVKKCSAQDFYSTFLQILYALESSKGIEFSHNNLTADNIIMRKVSDSPFVITYILGDGAHYIKSNGYIPTIVNFDKAHIKYINPDDKKEAKTQDQIYNPLSDAYNILCSCLYLSLKAMNVNIIGVFIDMLEFFRGVGFDSEGSLFCVIDSSKGNYNIPVENVRNKTIAQFITYTENYAKEHKLNAVSSKEENKKDTKLECVFASYFSALPSQLGGGCPKTQQKQALQNMGVYNEEKSTFVKIIDFFKSRNIPKTFLGFLDASGQRLKRIGNTKYSDDKQFVELCEGFFKEDNFTQALNQQEASINIFTSELNTFDLFTFPLNLEELLNENILSVAKMFYVKSAKYFKTLRNIEIAALACKRVMLFKEYIDKPELISRAETLLNRVQASLNLSKDFTQRLTDNINSQISIITVQDNPRLNEIYTETQKKENERYGFYWRMYIKLHALFR